jgi:propanediol dehydratase small subunit
MSIRKDITDAKRRFETHTEQHDCQIGRCDARRRLWLNYQRTAELCGLELDDAPRARAYYRPAA